MRCYASKSLILLAGVVGQRLFDDPIHLLVDGSQRLPKPVARLAGRAMEHCPIAGLKALSAVLLGQTRTARERCHRIIDTHGRSPSRNIAAEIAAMMGMVNIEVDGIPRRTHARILWKRGHMSEAISLLSSSPRGNRGMLFRLISEARSMDEGFLLDPPKHHSSRSLVDSDNANPRAFHVLTNSLPYTSSGYTHRTQRLLAALIRQGIPVRAATRLGYPATIGVLRGRTNTCIDNVVYSTILRPALRPGLCARLQQQVDLMANIVEEFSAGVLHCTTNYTNALMTDALARGLGLPWVYEVRGMLEETWAAGQKSSALQESARRSERFHALRSKETRMMNRADHVVTLSKVMRAEIIQRGIAPDKVSVVPNAVGEEYFSASEKPREVRRTMGLPADGFWVGSVSSLVAYEGFDLLLRSVAKARLAGYDIRVLLVGDGVSRRHLENLAIELAISHAVTFTGKVGPDDALNYHRCLDLFCVPRLKVEVCTVVTPLKPIEAMAVGTPTIMADLPPLRELAEEAYGQHADRGLFVPESVPDLSQKLVAAATSPFMDPETIRNARVFSRTRSWTRNAEIVEQIYQKITRK